MVMFKREITIPVTFYVGINTCYVHKVKDNLDIIGEDFMLRDT